MSTADQVPGPEGSTDPPPPSASKDAMDRVPGSSVGDDSTVTVSDRRRLINVVSDSSDEDEDSDDEQSSQRRRRRNEYKNSRCLTHCSSCVVHKYLWFQEATVKRNWYIVLGAWGLVFLGIACIVTGFVLEIVRHANSEDIIRGFIFFFVAVVVLIPGVYAVLHVYLAAKRVGRVRFSSVWFFR